MRDQCLQFSGRWGLEFPICLISRTPSQGPKPIGLLPMELDGVWVAVLYGDPESDGFSGQ